MTFTYEVKMRGEDLKWILYIPASNKREAGLIVWNKIFNEGRARDVESVFCVKETE